MTEQTTRQRSAGGTRVASESAMEANLRRVDPTHWANLLMQGTGNALRRYHRHTVRGLHHLTTAFSSGRPVVLVGNHCLDLVDPLMLTVAVYRETGRLLRFIAHGNLFFTIPGLRTLAPIWGLIPNRHVELADAAVRDEGALMLYPGSGTEAILRSYRREPYRLKWDGKHGFVQLAARHRATILFVAGIGIDEMYYQTDVPMPASAVRYGNAGDADYYQGARMQIGAAGLHVLPGVLPLPVRITHTISPPLALDPDLDPDDADAVAHAQIGLWAESQAFLDATVAARDSDLVDRGLRGAMAWLQRLGI
jgi:1-acyl-sn-glycerol-3-phosphate acyltransferase